MVSIHVLATPIVNCGVILTRQNGFMSLRIGQIKALSWWDFSKDFDFCSDAERSFDGEIRARGAQGGKIPAEGHFEEDLFGFMAAGVPASVEAGLRRTEFDREFVPGPGPR